MRRELVDAFITESGKRLINLTYHRGVGILKPWVIEVYVKRGENKPVLLSTSEYFGEEVARHDFEMRRPRMRDSLGEPEVPMQRGKRLVQEMLTEKLGPRDKS